MKSSSLFDIYPYGESDHSIVALVAGFASSSGSGKDLDRAAIDLAANGNTVIRYTHPIDILGSGDPYLLNTLIEEISEDFHERSIGFQAVRYCGVSLGGAVAAQMQRHDDSSERGYYAATGGNLADIATSPWFNFLVEQNQHVKIAQEFKKHGYDRDDLASIWSELQTAPATPFTVALGGIDRIVSQRAARANLKRWQAKNNDIEVMTAPFATHIDTIQRFDRTLGRLVLNETERLRTTTEARPKVPKISMPQRVLRYGTTSSVIPISAGLPAIA